MALSECELHDASAAIFSSTTTPTSAATSSTKPTPSSLWWSGRGEESDKLRHAAGEGKAGGKKKEEVMEEEKVDTCAANGSGQGGTLPREGSKLLLDSCVLQGTQVCPWALRNYRIVCVRARRAHFNTDRDRQTQ